jgi:hypothetical protein
MDRFGVEIVDGLIVIDTGTIVRGSPPGPESLDEPARGPSCTDGPA